MASRLSHVYLMIKTTAPHHGLAPRLLFLEGFQDCSPLLQINNISILEHVGPSAIGVPRGLRLSVKSLGQADFSFTVGDSGVKFSFKFMEQRQTLLSDDCGVVVGQLAQNPCQAI
jgi:hypothetical protein